MSVTLVCLSSGVKHISKIIVRQIYPVIRAFESECGLVYIFFLNL